MGLATSTLPTYTCAGPRCSKEIKFGDPQRLETEHGDEWVNLCSEICLREWKHDHNHQGDCCDVSKLSHTSYVSIAGRS